jgi:hypothetical protein
MRQKLTARLVIIVLLLPALPAAGFSTFGKNKVAYRDFDWRVLASEHFDIHFYPEERELAERTAALAEAAFDELSLRLGHVIHRRIPLFLYANGPSFQQTNTVDIMLPESVGGFTEYRKGRVVMPNNGDLSVFSSTLTHELVHVFAFDMMRDEIVARGTGNFTQPHLWFSEGLAEYFSDGDSAELAVYMRDLVLEDRLRPLRSLVGLGSYFILYKEGQSAVLYIAERFGETALVELQRGCYKSKYFEDVIEDVLGITFEQLDEDWRRWVQRRYFPEIVERRSLDEVGARLTREEETALAPAYAERDGEPGYCYLSNYYGYQALYWAPLRGDNDGELLLTAGRNPSLESLHMFTSALDVDDSGRVAFSARSGQGDELIIYDLDSDEVLERRGLPGVVSLSSPSWGPEGLVVVGLDESGRSDLYLVDLPDWRVQRLTDDYFYETDPVFTPDGGIIFASNRAAGEYDERLNLWRLDPDGGAPEQLTTGPRRDRAPFYDSAGRLHFFSDRGGARDLFRLGDDGGLVQLTSLFSGAFRGEFTPRGELLCEGLIGHNFAVYLVDELPENTEIVSAETEGETTGTLLVDSTPRTVDTTLEEYRTEFTLDVVRADTAYDPEFGAGLGTALALTDLTGDQRIILQLYSAGSSTASFFEYFNVAATYLNLENRLNWGAGAFHYVDDYLDYSTQVPYFERRYGGVGVVSYPFSRYTRLESNLVLRRSERYDYIGEFWTNRFLGSAYLGFVYDTTLWDMIGPIDGMRVNLQAGQTFDLTAGRSSYYTLWGDLRYYLRTSRRTTLAARAVGRLAEGDDARRAYFGGAMTMRGYPYGHFSGTRLYMGNLEWRFPLLDYIALGLPVGDLTFYEVQGALFFDVGAAWNAEETVPDPVGDFGVGFRVGLGPYLALRFDLAWLTDFNSVERDAEFGFYIGWNY